MIPFNITIALQCAHQTKKFWPIAIYDFSVRRGRPPPPSYPTTWNSPDGNDRRAMNAPFTDIDQKSYIPSSSEAISGGVRQSGKVPKRMDLEKLEKLLIRTGWRNADDVVRSVFGLAIQRAYNRHFDSNRLEDIPENPRKSEKVRYPEKSHRKFSLSVPSIFIGFIDVDLIGLHADISRYLLPRMISEPWRKKSEKSGKSRKSGGFSTKSGERIRIKSPSTYRFSLCTVLRVHAKFEPDRSSRLKVYYGEMHGSLYVCVCIGRTDNFRREKRSE